MTRLEDIRNRFLGASSPIEAGYHRTWNGLRSANARELAFGLFLLGITYLHRTRPQRELIYRQVVKEGSHVTVRNTPKGEPKLVVRHESD